jgi:hypothetical protein
MRSLLRALLLCTLFAGTASCERGALEPPRPAQITAETPTNRSSAPLGATLSPPLAVRVVDRGGNPVPGAAILWWPLGGGSVSEADSTTDAEGRARAVWTLGTNATQEQGVDVFVEGVSREVRFTVTTVVGMVSLKVVSGNNQSGIVGSTLPQPIVLELRGTENKPLAGVHLYLSGVGTLAPPNAQTNAQGRVSLAWTLPTTPGEAIYSMVVPSAAQGSQPSVTVRATAQPAP